MNGSLLNHERFHDNYNFVNEIVNCPEDDNECINQNETYLNE